MTALFVDIVGSRTAQQRSATVPGVTSWRPTTAARHQLDRFAGQEIDTAGDGLFAAFDGPARAVACGCAIRESARGLGLRIRAGLHAGEVELIAGKIGGLAVHIAARVAALASPDEVLVSRTIRDLAAGSGLHFEDRGVHVLKGVAEPWQLYKVAE